MKLLTVDMRQRPTLTDILRLPSVAARATHFKAAGNSKAQSVPVIDTIVVPRNLRELPRRLPGTNNPPNIYIAACKECTLLSSC